MRERKEMFYLTTRSTHLYLWIYGIGHMVKDSSDSDRGNPLPPLHGLLFLISSKVFSNMHHPTDRIAHTMAFVIPTMQDWLEWELEQSFHHEGSIRSPITLRTNALTTELHLERNTF